VHLYAALSNYDHPGGKERMDEILTAREAATLLKVHKRTVYRLAEEGIIPGSRIGHRWRFSKANILALVKSQSAVSPAEDASAAKVSELSE
jgi:excisionase family DNA binding protein